MAKKNEKEQEMVIEMESRLEQLIAAFEEFSAGIVENKVQIIAKLFEGEHAQKYAERVASVQPESGAFDLERIVEAVAAQDNSEDWSRLKQAFMVALSRHPGEDSELCAEGCALLKEIAEESRHAERSLTENIIKAEKEAEAANARLAAARKARKAFRVENNSRLRRAFRGAAEAGKEIGRGRYDIAGLNMPHAKSFSGSLASSYESIEDMCGMLIREFEFVHESAERRRTVPERVEYVVKGELPSMLAPSPSELAFIGQNDGKSGFREMLRGWIGR